MQWPQLSPSTGHQLQSGALLRPTASTPTTCTCTGLVPMQHWLSYKESHAAAVLPPLAIPTPHQHAPPPPTQQPQAAPAIPSNTYTTSACTNNLGPAGRAGRTGTNTHALPQQPQQAPLAPVPDRVRSWAPSWWPGRWAAVLAPHPACGSQACALASAASGTAARSSAPGRSASSLPSALWLAPQLAHNSPPAPLLLCCL